MKKTSRNAAVPILERKRIRVKGNESWLEKIQSNILKGHGREHVALLFVQFTPNHTKAVRALLRNLPITSALKQHAQKMRYKAGLRQAKALADPINLNLYLTAAGYRALEIAPGSDNAFVDGMANRGIDHSEHWEEPFRQEIHAMVAFANADPAVLSQAVADFERQAGNSLIVVGQQSGTKITNEHGTPIEHFGYADGISQPLFFEDDFVGITTRNWDPEAPLGLALTRDWAVHDEECLGSYLVFRKLEQNVQEFKAAEHLLAQQLDYTGTAEEAAGAMIVGRFEGGLPVLRFGSTISPEEHNHDNDFNYAGDTSGSRCPFHAHIRKTNPRGDTVRFFDHTEAEERAHRIVRRGITYGDRRTDERGLIAEDDHPSGGVGLLFICFQGSIERQFEHIQRAWANNNDFPCPFSGIDPVIGQGKNRQRSNGAALEQQWQSAGGARVSHSFSDFITLKGGEYFFAPSLPFFKSL